MPKSRMTIQDIADAVGVSKTTVSRYFNGKYNYMSEETRRKIERVIRETDFRPNKLAGSLKTDRTDLIGLVIPDASSMLTPYLITSVCDECTVTGRRTIVVSTHNDTSKEQRRVKELMANQVDGIIVATGNDLSIYHECDAAGVPVVFVDRIPGNARLDTVVVDHQDGCKKAVHRLIDHGFQRIVYMVRASVDGYGTFALRDEAVRSACAERGISFEKVLVNDSAIGDAHRFRKEMQRVYGKCQGMSTALFMGEGLLMGHVLCAFSQMGITYSDDFTIAGYDDTRLAATSGSQFLLINQPLCQMGATATRMLIGRIEGLMDTKEKVRCFLDCALMIPENF